MKTPFNFPDCKTETYRMNAAIGYYEKQPQKIAFNKLPFELKVEPTQEEKIKAQGANEIIHGRIKNGKYLFFTGLIPAGVEGWYIGNNFEFVNNAKKLSLIIFHFAEDGSILTVYYFNWWYIHNRDERKKFVELFIEQKKTEAITPPLSVQFSATKGSEENATKIYNV